MDPRKQLLRPRRALRMGAAAAALVAALVGIASVCVGHGCRGTIEIAGKPVADPIAQAITRINELEVQKVTYTPVQQWTGGNTNLPTEDVNNWAPDGIQTNTFIVTRGADNQGTRITGIDATGIKPGDIRFFVNLPTGASPPLDSGTVTFLHENTGSLPANRIQTPDAMPCTFPMYSVIGVYYGGLDADGSNRWRLLSSCGYNAQAHTQGLHFYPICQTTPLSPVSGTQNNYRPTCYSVWGGYGLAGTTTDSYEYSTLRVNTALAGATLTGLYTTGAQSDPLAYGSTKIIQNIGTGPLTLKNLDAGSDVQNRFTLPQGQDLILQPNESAFLISPLNTGVDLSSGWQVISVGQSNSIFPSVTTSGTLAAGGPVEFSGVTTPSALASGTTQNYNPGSRNFIWRLTPSSPGSTIGGIVAPSLGHYEWHFIENISSTIPLSFTNLDAGSSNANRIQTPRGLTTSIGGGGGALIRYDWGLGLWTIVSTTGSATSVQFTPGTTPVANCFPTYTDTNGTLSSTCSTSDNGSVVTLASGRILSVPASTTFSNGVAFSATLAAFAPSWSGRLAPTALTSGSNTNDWNPTGLHTRMHIAITTSTSSLATLTGMNSTSADGEMHDLCNFGPGPLKITNNDTNSTAAQRFTLAGATDITLPSTSGQNNCITVRYDSSDLRWEEMASNTLGRNASTPAASSCGSGPTFSTVSTNNFFTLTTGSGATACTVTFGGSGFTDAPVCTVTARTGSNQAGLTYTTSTTALTMSAAAASAVYDVVCRP